MTAVKYALAIQFPTGVRSAEFSRGNTLAI